MVRKRYRGQRVSIRVKSRSRKGKKQDIWAKTAFRNGMANSYVVKVLSEKDDVIVLTVVSVPMCGVCSNKA